MPAAAIEAPASIRRQALFLPGRRLYSQTENGKPGLQEEISLFPFSIIEILRSFMKPGIASDTPLHLGGGVSFQEDTISVQAEWIIKGDAIYYIEPLSFTVNEAARWGFLEIKLTDEEGEPTGLDFWDSSIDRAAFKEANTKILNKVLIQENYNITAEFPQVSEGYTKWISYKKDAAGALGVLQSAEHLPSQNFSIHSPGSASKVPTGIITGKVSRDSEGSPVVQAGTYEVSGSAVDLSQPIAVSAQDHNYGSGELRAASWYLVLLSPSGQARTHLYAGQEESITKNISINEIEKVRDGISRLYVPNSTDLTPLAGALASGVFLYITGAAQPTNNGVFEIESLDNTDDSGRAGYKEILIKNTHIQRETEESNINITAEAFTAFADGAISNPPLGFAVQKNGYYSDLLTTHRIIGTFYTDSTGAVSHVYSLASSCKWLGGVGKNIGTVYLIFADREPPWGLIANGAEVSIAEYPELYAEIRDKFGAASTEGMFKLPDARGRFLRAMDLGSGLDPDAASRTRTDGESGDLPGSVQDHAMQGHKHNDSGHSHIVPDGDDVGGGSQADSTSSSNIHVIRTSTGFANLGNPSQHQHGAPNISRENRPTNIALMPVIKF